VVVTRQRSNGVATVPSAPVVSVPSGVKSASPAALRLSASCVAGRPRFAVMVAVVSHNVLSGATLRVSAGLTTTVVSACAGAKASSPAYSTR